MRLQSLEICGFKSFGKKTAFVFDAPVTAIVGPNGSGKSNVCDALRFVLGEQSVKSLRARRGEDLIFNGSRFAPRQNRASVKLCFDQYGDDDGLSQAPFLPAHGAVTIERVVHRDGVNEYLLNGSRARLKDILDLLAHMRAGASGNHIISQGEADRILRASPAERRELVEDALGLAVYRRKIAENKEKFEQTEANMVAAQNERHDLAPRLAVLRREMKRLERVRETRANLVVLVREYATRELSAIETQRSEFFNEAKRLHADRAGVIAEEGDVVDPGDEWNTRGESARERASIASALAAVRSERERLARDIGRVEGESRSVAGSFSSPRERWPVGILVPLAEVEELARAVDRRVREARAEKPAKAPRLERTLEAVRRLLHAFVIAAHSREGDNTRRVSEGRSVLSRVADDQFSRAGESLLAELEESMRRVRATEDELTEREGILAARESARGQEREKEASRRGALALARERIERGLRDITGAEAALDEREKSCRILQGEVAAVVGREALTLRSDPGLSSGENFVGAQESRRREIERGLLRLEDLSRPGREGMAREYDTLAARDEFLAREIGDLEQARASLRELTRDLEAHLSGEFTSGLLSLNAKFQEFFTTLFGGGSAALVSVDSPRTAETGGGDSEETSGGGIVAEVNIPGKRVKGLDALSGGERALVSIALVFALSHANPPPFLILDETDAALDEANSRRYGDLIVRLAERSQLVIVTHNRETMSRAGVLHGVTMQGSGLSQLLSVSLASRTAESQIPSHA